MVNEARKRNNRDDGKRQKTGGPRSKITTKRRWLKRIKRAKAPSWVAHQTCNSALFYFTGGCIRIKQAQVPCWVQAHETRKMGSCA